MPERLAFVGAELIDPERAAPRPATLLVEGSRIIDQLEAAEALSSDWRRVDGGAAFIAPGFIDVHFHGACATAAESDLPTAFERDRDLMLSAGTTSFLATTLCWPHDKLASYVARVAALSDSNARLRPACLGVHLEGPWISPDAAGALAVGAMRDFSDARDAELLDRAEGRVRLVTLAPERDGARELLQTLGRRGIAAALGHSRASAEEIAQGVELGLQHATHLFNAMGPMHHREPGVAGSVLDELRLSCDLICDGHHVHPAMVRLAARVLGDRLLLITDRVDLAGVEPAGAEREAGAPLDAPLRLPNGVIAGSRLDMASAIDRFRSITGVDVLEAVAAATLRPARLLGVERERGTLRVGARADLVFFDEVGRIAETWIGGVRADA